MNGAISCWTAKTVFWCFLTANVFIEILAERNEQRKAA
jgi:hypothetical protein